MLLKKSITEILPKRILNIKEMNINSEIQFRNYCIRSKRKLKKSVIKLKLDILF